MDPFAPLDGQVNSPLGTNGDQFNFLMQKGANLDELNDGELSPSNGN